MTNPNPLNKFQPGNPGGGRPKLPEEIKEIRSSTKIDILCGYYKIAQMTLEQAKEYKPENLLEAGIMKCFSDFIHTGKTDQIRHVWAECHGKPKESIDITTDGEKLPSKIEIIKGE